MKLSQPSSTHVFIVANIRQYWLPFLVFFFCRIFFDIFTYSFFERKFKILLSDLKNIVLGFLYTWEILSCNPWDKAACHDWGILATDDLNQTGLGEYLLSEQPEEDMN